MFWYYFVFFWIAFLAFISSRRRVTVPVMVLGQSVPRWRLGWAVAAFFPIYYLAVFTQPRFDTVLYLATFRSLSYSFAALGKVIAAHESGWLFTVFEIVVKMLFGNSQTAFRVLLGLIHSIPIILIYRKYSSNYILSLYLFAATGCHLGWMMNGLRQFMAVVLIFSATPLMLRKKYIPVVLIILVASAIHTSALIMLPVVFAAQGRAWNRRTLLFLALSVAAMFAFVQYSGLVDTLLEDTEYAGLMSNAEEWGDDGVNPLRVLVSAVPVVLAFIGRKNIEADDDPLINLCVNMSIATLAINLIAMVTSGIMIGRLPIYTSLYNFILLPYLLVRLFNKPSSKIVTGLAVGLYAVFYLAER